MFRYQVESFMRSHRSPGVACFDNDFKEIISAILESADITVSRDCNGNLEVALDEAHEMEINLKTKKAINTFSLPSLTAMTYYLPYRAETLHNLKVKLDIESGRQVNARNCRAFIHSEEQTIFQYVEKLKVSSLFVDDLVCNLHIFTHTTATTDQADFLLRYRYYGREDMNNYIQCFLIRVSDISVKQPQRKRRNLKTLSSPKVTVYKQKKEIKDNKTVFSCLRKQIAFSKLSSEPVTDLDQFLALPRAICDAEGILLKGQKSLSLHHFRSRYPDAFLSALPTETGLTAVILEGMFMINSNQTPQHKTFGDYTKFIFDRWIVRSYKQFSASEIHVVFDHPNRHDCSPKDVERSRRDSSVLATNSAFNSVVHEDGMCTVITAGGFDDDNRDKALGISSLHVGIVEFAKLSANHEEDALKLHWDRRCWVAKYWKQALDNSMHLETIDKSGWIITNAIVSVVWDFNVNIDKGTTPEVCREVSRHSPATPGSTRHEEGGERGQGTARSGIESGTYTEATGSREREVSETCRRKAETYRGAKELQKTQGCTRSSRAVPNTTEPDDPEDLIGKRVQHLIDRRT
ncbi:unnamed protein product [Mytilus coruscus]|uniref:Uncharacterized protein n=1 Tax=Mytilus coruscus TaxID=42192 RepID=A0A6J8D3H0_MYTCO|nr:unnamed protein product [Mytilus coruscus]